MKKILLSLICLLAVVGVNAATVTDVITPAIFGVPVEGGTQSYKTFTSEPQTSGAIYNANLSETPSVGTVLQLRWKNGTPNNCAGIVSTVSGGYAKNVTVNWNSETAEARILAVYGSNTAYESYADLQDTEKCGTEIAQLKCSEATDLVSTLEITGEYKYIAFRSTNGALYLNSIEVVWDSEGGQGGGEDPNPPTPPTPSEDEETATFDWTNPEALNPAQNKPEAEAAGAVNISGLTFTDNDVTVSFAKETATTDTRLYLTTKEAVELRTYKNSTMTVTAPSGKNITNISFDVNYDSNFGATASSGDITAGKPTVWKGEANSVVFTWTINSKINSMTVTYGGEGNGEDPNPPTPPTPGEGYDTLADWMTAKPATDTELNATLTAIFQDGKDLWVCDEAGSYALVYGTIEQTYKNGDRIPAPVSGKYEEYNGMPEFVPVASTFGAGEAGDAVAAKAVEIGDLTIADVARYVRLEGVQISSTDNELNFEATDGTNTVVLRNRYSKSITIPVTDDATVYGFVGIYNSTIQIYPTLIESENPGPGSEPTENTATFDFNTPSSLNPAQAMPGEGAEGAVNLSNKTLSNGNVTITFNLPADLEGKSKDPRLYLYKGNSELRMYSGTSMTVATTDGAEITRIEFQVSYADNVNANVNTGEITTGKPSYWNGNAQSVTFDWTATSKANKILVTTTNGAGIESVEAIELTPAVFYNLQGIRVDNPANGIYIRVRGNNVDKVLVK